MKIWVKEIKSYTEREKKRNVFVYFDFRDYGLSI